MAQDFDFSMDESELTVSNSVSKDSGIASGPSSPKLLLHTLDEFKESTHFDKNHVCDQVKTKTENPEVMSSCLAQVKSSHSTANSEKKTNSVKNVVDLLDEVQSKQNCYDYCTNTLERSSYSNGSFSLCDLKKLEKEPSENISVESHCDTGARQRHPDKKQNRCQSPSPDLALDDDVTNTLSNHSACTNFAQVSTSSGCSTHKKDNVSFRSLERSYGVQLEVSQKRRELEYLTEDPSQQNVKANGGLQTSPDSTIQRDPAQRSQEKISTDTLSSPSNFVGLDANSNCKKNGCTDPFDLFSDEEAEPKKYQPIKRRRPPVPCVTEPVTELTIQDAPDVKRSKKDCQVVYVHSDELMHRVNQLIRIEGRANLVHSLINAYGLLQYIKVVSPRSAVEAEILGFHAADYIDFLRDVSNAEKLPLEAENYGLSFDCPLQDGLLETASLIGGASIVAADTIISGEADIAINWYGGWHHAKRDSASGFCYINDIVLAILKLREKYDKVLYVDVDLHHGDGVEEAFSLTSKVMTVSFHKYATGFFPGSGNVHDVGSNRGKFYAVNVPLYDGIKDAEFCNIFFRVMKMVRERFNPEAVVMQCGADSLSEDPMASFNLTHIGLAKCVCHVLTWNLPTLLLGGGGYNFANTAKCWTFLTAMVAHKKLPLDIPEHENLLEYGPDYQMMTTVGNRRDCNTKEYLSQLLCKIAVNLRNI